MDEAAPRALVTGASGGIGAAVVRELAGAGWRVWLGGRRRGALARLAAETGGVALPFDVADPAQAERARDALGEAPDLLVNAAGVFETAPAERTGADLVRRALRVNLEGAVNVTRALLPGMLAGGGGLVIHIGSVAGWRPFPENAAYSASKYGLRGFHEVLCEELRGTGARSCLIDPAAVDTPAWDPLDPDASPDLPSRGDMLRPGDVARAVAFVAGLPATVSVPLLRIERA